MRPAAWTVLFVMLLSLPLQGQDRVRKLMQELTEVPGPSGFEDAVRRIVERELRELGAEISHDGLGSVIGRVPGRGDRPRIMVAAHLDEVGLMVQYIQPDGFLRFKTLGGWFNQALVDQRWTILTRRGPVAAVSGIRTVHVSRDEDRTWGLNELFLDVGARSRQEAEELGVRPGDPVAPWSPFLELASGRYAAKAWDDRVGLAVMLEALRRLREEGTVLPGTVFFVGTAQEEVGLRGAQTATRMVRPDLGISLEAGVAGDYPGGRPDQAQERLGEGPGIFLLDSSMIPNTRLRDFILELAREEGIALQTEVLSGYGEDGAEIQRFDTGRPAVNLTVPVRYLHAHTGLIDRSDFDRVVLLLMALLKRLDEATVQRLAGF